MDTGFPPQLLDTGSVREAGTTDDGLTFTAEHGLNDTSASAAYFHHITATLWSVVPPVLLILGTFGNVMTVVVMRGMRTSHSTACLSVYFTALALSDQFLLTATTVNFWVENVFAWPPSFFRYDLLCKIPSYVWYTCSFTSSWFLVTMTYQRVTSVVAPHRVGVLCTVRRGQVIVTTIATSALLFNLPLLFLLTYDSEYGECVLRTRLLHFTAVFTLTDLIVVSAIPFLFLIIGNSVLIWQVLTAARLSRTMRGGGGRGQQDAPGNRRVNPMTRTLLLTSTAFLVFSLPTCVFDLYDRTSSSVQASDGELKARIELVEAVVFFLWMSTGATNFYLYLLSGRRFRQEAKRYLCLSSKPC